MGLIDLVLADPVFFDWQQRLCNNYDSIPRHFADYLDVTGKDILEIGCSTAACAKAAVKMDRNRYIGIDIISKYVEFAAKRSPQGTFITMDARELTFDAHSFDVVLIVGALHHMDPETVRACFKEIKRVLRNDGVVLCAEPLFTPGKWFSNFLLRNDRGRYIRTEAGYRGLFEGFTIAREGYFRFSAHRFASFVLQK